MDALRTSILIGVGLLLVTTPAIAEYYIVRETAVGPCKIVESRPDDAKSIVGGDRSYATRAEAEKEIPLLCKLSRDPIGG
jgi:hypothetical protein